jgi:hypothetical protein
MAALVSPGISITVIDESQYLPTAVGTVPFVLFASGENKVINNAVAPGTKKSNAGKVYGISSQRELVSTFGAPNFRTNAAGTPLHADELNEYGLMAAYSALGLGNRVWAIRADINLDELVGTTVRPIGEVPDGTNWLDTSATTWGIYQYDQVNDQFSNQVPTVISSWNDITVQAGIPTPNQSLGKIGEYAVVVNDANNYVFYKNALNIWVQVGGLDWQASFPAVGGANSAPNFVNSGDFTINGTTVTIPGGTPDVATVVSIINALMIDGVEAAVENGFLALYVNGLSASNGTTADGAITLIDGNNTPLNELGVSVGTYYAPTLYYGSFNQNPAWSTFDAVPRPSGSIWLKTSVSGAGANFVVKQWNGTTKAWTKLATPIYGTGYTALYGIDSTGGGASIRAGGMFIKYDTNNDGNLSFKVYELTTGGETEVAGSTAAGTFVSGSTFTMLVSQPGTDMPSTYNITLGGTNASDFVTAILAANIPNVTARVNNSGVITLVHSKGGLITLVNTTVGSNPVTTAGFSTSTQGVVPNIVPGSITLTNWALARYTFSDTEPYTAPADDRLWYYSDPTAVDIMIADTSGWKGYKNVSRDARGFNLQDTDPRGVIVAASEPTTQSDNTDLVPGDLWLDSSDLENYPRIYRRTATNKWQLINNTDRVSQNGIVFADVRWDGFSDDTGGTTDPITGNYPSVADMQHSNYTDLDAPDYRLFPRGTLLFNTRRSGYNVKKYVGNYFNEQAYPNTVLPDVTAAWVTDSGNKEDGTPYAGHYAQRAIIVRAMKAALDGSLDIREEGYNFNLLTCPGYPELIVNLIALNNDRSNTGFIIGDTPMTLPATITDITQYNNNVATNRDPYVALYYPSALTNDLSGNEIVVPASHIMLRTYIRNDNVAYQWFAPAGTRRGLVDNATAIGFVDPKSGLFVRTGISNSIRDAMYELNLNPITLLLGTGLVVYGQKTRNPVSSSLDRVNVARLVNYLRTVLQPLANQFLFEPNDKITRDQVKQVVESVLNDLIAKRGLYDYLVVCDTSNNTPDRIARSELYIDIAVEPMKAVEFIYIPIRLKNPGAISGGTA